MTPEPIHPRYIFDIDRNISAAYALGYNRTLDGTAEERRANSIRNWTQEWIDAYDAGVADAKGDMCRDS